VEGGVRRKNMGQDTTQRGQAGWGGSVIRTRGRKVGGARGEGLGRRKSGGERGIAGQEKWGTGRGCNKRRMGRSWEYGGGNGARKNGG